MALELRLIGFALALLATVSCDGIPQDYSPTAPSPAVTQGVPIPPPPTPTPSPGASPPSTLVATAVSASASKSTWGYRVSLALSFENRGNQDELLAYQQNSGALIDSQGLAWWHVSISGIPMTASQPPRRDDFARLPAGGRQVIILNFETSGDVSRASSPTMLSVSMLCWRLRGDTPERFSVGLSQITVGR